MAYGMISKTSVNDEEDLNDISYAYGSVMGQEAQADSGVYYSAPEETTTTPVTTSDPLANNRTLALWQATSSGGSGSSGTAATPIGQTTVSGTKYAGTAPTIGELPKYTAPAEWSGTKMAGEVQKKAALGLRQARQALREATAGLGTDPASRLALRQALAQHGINIQGTISQAESAAETAEANELARKTAEAQTNFQAEINNLYQTYQAEWNKYVSTGESYSTTENVYADGSSDGSGKSTKSYFSTLGYSDEDLKAAQL